MHLILGYARTKADEKRKRRKQERIGADGTKGKREKEIGSERRWKKYFVITILIPVNSRTVEWAYRSAGFPLVSINLRIVVVFNYRDPSLVGRLLFESRRWPKEFLHPVEREHHRQRDYLLLPWLIKSTSLFLSLFPFPFLSWKSSMTSPSMVLQLSFTIRTCFLFFFFFFLERNSVIFYY